MREDDDPSKDLSGEFFALEAYRLDLEFDIEGPVELESFLDEPSNSETD
jgi:hypothetical protein